MRRLALSAAVALLLPVMAWRAVSAEPTAPQHDPPACDPATTTTTAAVETTLAPDGCPEPAQPPPETTAGPTTTTTTTTVPVDPNATTTTTIADPNATTTTLDPASTTTTIPVDPGATTTTATVVDPAPPPPVDPGVTVDPNATTTTLPPVEVAPVAPVVEVLEAAPVVEPPVSEGGRVVVAAGVAETGQVRAVTFPVAGPVRYFNDFGACRDSCRRQHKGNDIIGDRLQPLLAMRDGVVDRLLDHPTAGFGIVIEDADGWEYHLYHVNNDSPGSDDGADDGGFRFAPGMVPGARVTAGQVIAFMGDSGNSEGSVPHAHVEIHTPDGAAINPFWSLRLAQRDVNCAIPAPPPVDDPATAAAAVTDATIAALAAPATDPEFLESSWASAEVVDGLPGAWTPLSITGGRPGSGDVVARMWVGAAGFTPVDAAALRVGDARYDEDCSQPSTVMTPAVIPAELGAILATIRAMETGGNYTTQVTSSTASGAYGFLDSSWGGFGGYRRARDAPPPVQDAKAAELATSILSRNAGDVSTIPVSWYIGHVPIGAEWDTVPTVGNNKLTPREYQQRWLRRYAQILGTPDQWVGTAPDWTPVDTAVTCRTVVVDVGPPGDPQYALTQANAFTADATGRAVLAALDPCDPNRPVPAAVAPEPEPAVLRPSGSS